MDELCRRADGFAALRLRYRVRSERVGQVRFLCFAIALGLFGAALAWQSYATFLALTGGACLVAFAGLLVFHDRIIVLEQKYGALEGVNRRAELRSRRRWGTLGEEAACERAGHGYAMDLAVLGHASVFGLIWAGGTGLGRHRLLQWLLGPDDVSTIVARQQAVAEMVGESDLRDDLAAGSELFDDVAHSEADAFLRWLEEPDSPAVQPALIWLSRALPPVTAAFVAARIAGADTALFAAGTFAASVGILLYTRTPLRQTLRSAGKHAAFVSRVCELARVLCRSGTSPYLLRLQEQLRNSSGSAYDQLSRLGRILHAADARHSRLSHLMLNVLGLWDVHILNAIAHWKRQIAPSSAQWLAVMADAEATASLASLAYAHPEWAVPTFDSGDDCIVATALGHPLLVPSTSVSNDLILGPPGSILVISGSNMSGKSTFLRAIGLNIVLANAGAPVCALGLSLPGIVRVLTCMNVPDSLQQGRSQFMAEILRLRSIVEQGESYHATGQCTLYLLDEILYGTNPQERRQAVPQLLSRLSASCAISVLATHEPELANVPALASYVRHGHFGARFDQVGPEPGVAFDYRLRDGVATSATALALMRSIGLLPAVR